MIAPQAHTALLIARVVFTLKVSIKKPESKLESMFPAVIIPVKYACAVFVKLMCVSFCT